jgi:hypothetical protein
VRQADGRAALALGRLPGLQHLPQVPRHALDADRRQVSEGRRRDRGAAQQEARQGVLRLRELSDVRLSWCWDKPVLEACPECGYMGAEAKSNKTRGTYRKCLKCQNEWDVETPEGADAEAEAATA